MIDVFMTEEEPDELGSQFTVLLRAVTGGAAHSFAEYRTWLEEAGYDWVERLSEKWLKANRPT